MSSIRDMPGNTWRAAPGDLLVIFANRRVALLLGVRYATRSEKIVRARAPEEAVVVYKVLLHVSNVVTPCEAMITEHFSASFYDVVRREK